MAYQYTRIPPIQTLCWRPATDDLPVRYNFHNFDDALAFDRLDSGSGKFFYAQQVQTTDKVMLYLDTNGTSITVECYSSNGTQDGVLESTQTFNTPAGTFSGCVSPTGIQLSTFYVQLTVPTTEKYVQYKCVVTYSGGATESFLTEMCHIKPKHADTRYFEYTHNKNEHSVRFENLNILFAFRVYGEQPILITGTDAVLTESYNKEMRPVKIRNYRSWKFSLGTKKGLPDWAVDRINWILACSTIRENGKLYGREEETKLDAKDIKGYPLKEVSFQLRDFTHENYGYTTSTEIMLSIPSYPAAIPKLLIVYSLFPLLYLQDNTPRVFSSQTDLENYKDYLNNTFAVNNNMQGVFSRVGDVIYYENAPGETFVQTNNTILTTYIFYSLTFSTGLAWRYKFTFGDYHVVDWGDSTVEAMYSNSTTVVSANHTYGSTGSYTVRIFHNNQIKTLATNESTFSGIVRNVGGNAPSQLQVFDLRYANLSALGENFNPSFLFPARFTMVSLIMSTSKIDGFNTALFASTGPPNTGVWALLTYLDLRVNTLSSAEVDEIFNNRYFNGTVALGGTYLLNLQTPPQAPTTASLTARQAMQVVLACSITTD